MKMVVGLGNPDEKYSLTRHNVGFMVLDSFVDGFSLEKKFEALVKILNVNGNKVLFVKPLTYMNESGRSVIKLASYYDILPKDILVIHDDMDMDFGKFKLKFDSSSGGHNGIKSIINSLGTQKFCRLKIGIGHSDDTINYVLGNFTRDEQASLRSSFALYEEIINSFISDGIEVTMNRYNVRSG